MCYPGSQAQPAGEFLCGLVSGCCGSRPKVRSTWQQVPCRAACLLQRSGLCFGTSLRDRNPNMCHSAIQSTLVNYTILPSVYKYTKTLLLRKISPFCCEEKNLSSTKMNFAEQGKLEKREISEFCCTERNLKSGSSTIANNKTICIPFLAFIKTSMYQGSKAHVTAE